MNEPIFELADKINEVINMYGFDREIDDNLEKKAMALVWFARYTQHVKVED